MKFTNDNKARQLAAAERLRPRSGADRTPDSRYPSLYPGPDEEMLTAKDLEAMLKIDVKTIYGWARQNAIPHLRLGSSIRFSKREIFDWLEKHSCRPR